MEKSFDNFVVGDFNRLVYDVARKVAESEKTTFNPLFIHSHVGNGKTHLLFSIANYLKANKPNIKWYLIRGEDPKEEIGFEKLKEMDMLLVDDLQYINLEAQSVIIKISNLLLSKNKQVVLSANKPPDELVLDERLLSGINSGLVIEISPPEFEDRKKIFKQFSEGMDISDEVVEIVSRKSVASVSELHGMMNKLIAYRQIEGKPIDSDALYRLGIMKKEKHRPKRKGEFENYISDVTETLPEDFVKVGETERLRDEYRQRLFVWEMKGFDVSRLKKVIDENIESVTSEFISFTTYVQRLVELQKRYGMLDVRDFPEDANSIESKLFSPYRVVEVEAEIANLGKKILQKKGRVEEKKPSTEGAPDIQLSTPESADIELVNENLPDSKIIVEDY